MAKSSSKSGILFGISFLVLLSVAAWFVLKTNDSIDTPEKQDAGDKGEAATTGGVTGLLQDVKNFQAISGGLIRIECDTGDENHAISGPEGEFSISDVRPGPCTVIASAKGYVAGGRKDEARIRVQVRAGKVLSKLKIRLYKTSQVSGRVMALDKPAVGARLSVLYLEAPEETQAFSLDIKETSGSDGTFRISDLGPGRIQVVAELAEFALAESKEIFLESGSEVGGINIQLGEPAIVIGKIVDQDNKPIAKAEVRLLTSGSLDERSLQSDDQGLFRFEQVKPGDFMLFAKVKGYAPEKKLNGSAPPGQTTEVTIVLRPVAGLAGRVQDPSGELVANSFVFIRTAKKWKYGVSTDLSGEFWIPGPFKKDQINLFAMHRGWGPSAEVSVPIAADRVVLELTEPGSISGLVVRAADGKPVHQYKVSARTAPDSARLGLPMSNTRSSTVRDASGRFKLGRLAAGNYIVKVYAAGYTTGIKSGVTVQNGQNTDAGTIYLTAGGDLIGKIVDDKTGLAVARAHARVESFAGLRHGVFSDPQGMFRLEGVSAERLSLWIRKRGYLSEMVTGIQVPSGGELDIGVIRIEPAKDDRRGSLKYAGVGMTLKIEDGQLLAFDVYQDSPASQMGLLSGAVITRINGFDFSGLDLRRAVELIRGKPGTSVILDVILPGSSQSQIIRIERANIRAR
ncbi:MAG: carboxypeptidase regulatory-like domain-containing protein [Deltaproteobacteria bacterium]|nr:carboxypeptidase regulatory-like domain-containing protein [Deltaproteobacteria bacterium]